MKRLASGLLLALAMTGPALGQVHKCEVDGQTIYQSSPCQGGVESSMQGSVSIHEATEPSDFEPYQPPQRNSRRPSSSSDGYSSSLERRNAEASARARDKVLVGMSERQVTSILGRPDEVETQESSSRSCKLMYYWSDHEITDYIRVCDGEVTYARQ